MGLYESGYGGTEEIMKTLARQRAGGKLPHKTLSLCARVATKVATTSDEYLESAITEFDQQRMHYPSISSIPLADIFDKGRSSETEKIDPRIFNVTRVIYAYRLFREEFAIEQSEVASDAQGLNPSTHSEVGSLVTSRIVDYYLAEFQV